jgi:uncharacterized protein with HEPN domain
MSLSKLDKNLLYLLTILEAIEKIKIYTKEYSSVEDFFNANVQKDFNAVLNLLIAIGEESRKISDALKSISTKVNWSAIVNLRNKLSHDYRGVDVDIVWDIIQNYLDPLKNACVELVIQISPEKEVFDEILKSAFYRNIGYLKEILFSKKN